MARNPRARALVSAALLAAIAGCATPFRDPLPAARDDPSPASRFRPAPAPPSADAAPAPTLTGTPTLADYIRFALFASPRVEAAYQRWRAAAERVPQVGALPDPRLTVGVFVEEVQTRTGPQDARVGVQQTFPWPGVLKHRADAASRDALAAWRAFESERLAVTERVTVALAELAYLDAAIGVTRENLALLQSFEGVVRARYRVGAGSHPELIRAQVELGLLEDRLAELTALRPALVAEVNAALGRDADEPVAHPPVPSAHVLAQTPAELARRAREVNPDLLALDERAEAERARTRAARADGYPDVTLGVDYIVTGDAVTSGVAGSGDDPVLVTLGLTLPIWREKESASVREATARRLALTRQRDDGADRLAAAVHRAYFDHTDADRRARLYSGALIPKAQESLRASLAAFRTGDAGFLDVLDAERTLLEYALTAERARADRAVALARLHTLTGGPIPAAPAPEATP